MSIEILEYTQWKEQYGSALQPDEFFSVSDLEHDFMKFHGLNIHDEIEQINQQEYQLYLQRVNAGLGE